MQDLTIALVQAELHWEQIDANLAMFEEILWTVDADVDLIALPEMFTTGFSMNPQKLSEPSGGKTHKWMRQMATLKKAAVVGSYIVKEGSKYYNRLSFVFPDGKSETYDKKHLFTLAGEDNAYLAGNERKTFKYKGWKISPLICYDLRFPVWARSVKTEMEDYEYDLLLYVANWPQARITAWDTLLKARAIENTSYCIGVNRTGTDGYSKEYPGHTGAYAYDGKQLLFSKKKEEVLIATLSADRLTKFRNRFNFQADADFFEIK